MDKKITHLHSTFSVNNEFIENDSRFLYVTIDVLHTGKNYNDSFFTKEVVNSCIESIKNTAVLGFIKYDNSTGEYDFKGHEYVLTRTENGIEEKYIGHAYGVIPESCSPRWITKYTDDGEKEFLQVDAILWEKFSDSTSILRRDTEKSQSMELEVSSVEGYEDEEDGLFHFESFKFDGCCILGDGVAPAMIDANVTIKENQFTLNDFVKNVQNELISKYTIFTKLVDEKKDQGGIGIMPNTDFTQTVLEQFSDISQIVSQYEIVQDRWGDSVPRFYLQDVQDNEVIVVDRNDNYHYYGFPFTISGDKPEIDFACGGKRKKVRYEDYEEGTVVPDGAFNFGEHISKIEETAFSKVTEANEKVDAAEQAKSEIETNYTQVKADYDEIKPKYDKYVQDEEQRHIEELDAQKDSKFAEYEDVLSENADFSALKERKAEMSIDDIEKECAVLYVKVSRAKHSFSKSGSSAVLGIIEDGGDPDGADNYVSTKYGNIPIKR